MRYGVLPVTRDGTYLGIITARAVSEALFDGRHEATPAELLVELPSLVREDTEVADAIRALDASECGALPVLAATGPEVVGWFDYRDALSGLEPVHPT